MAKILRYVLAPARTVARGVTIEGDAIVVSASLEECAVRVHRRDASFPKGLHARMP